MSSDVLAAIARHWWEFQRLATGSRDERKALSLGQPEDVQAAYDAVEDAVDRGGRFALDVMAALIEAAPPGKDATAVGAGPLENLLHEHGDDLIDAVEVRARTEPSFSAALSVVAIERGHLRPATEQRLAPWIGRFTGGR